MKNIRTSQNGHGSVSTHPGNVNNPKTSGAGFPFPSARTRRPKDCRDSRTNIVFGRTGETENMDKLSPSEAGLVPAKRKNENPDGNPPEGTPIFDDKIIQLIVKVANEGIENGCDRKDDKIHDKIHMFKEEITEDHFKIRQDNQMVPVLSSLHNTLITYFFGKLRENNLIPRNWEQIICKNKLILSSTGRGPLNNRSMASTLSRFKSSLNFEQSKKWMIELNEDNKTTEKNKHTRKYNVAVNLVGIIKMQAKELEINLMNTNI